MISPRVSSSASMLCLPRLYEMQMAPPLTDVRSSLRYWLADHPTVAHFRWDHDAWGSSWAFLVMVVVVYLLGISFLKLVLVKRKRPLPLGPIPPIHNFIVLVVSVAIFVGCWEATAVEIRETRWIWRKSKNTATEWILCFPLGTRPAGRVFFWSYVFYLSKCYEFFDTVIWVLRKKPLSFVHIFHHIMVVCMCFLWLEFSQSLQILAILSNTMAYVITHSHPYFFCSTNIAVNCQVVEFVLTLVAHIWSLRLHFSRNEGCSGMGASLFNAFFNTTLFLLFFFNFYNKKRYKTNPTLQESEGRDGQLIKAK